MAFIELSKITKRYGDTVVVRDLSLRVRRGELVVLLGPSGCGKSTLLRIVAGLLAPSAGTVSIDGRDVTSLTPGDRDVAMVFQSYALYPHMTVSENIAFPLRVRRVPAAEQRKRVREVADTLGLGELLGRHPRDLSGGQRQRVAMGRAMVRQPKVFLFDEPLSNLDATLRGKMRAEIAGLHRRLGATMLYVTHDQQEAMALADRIVLLNDGSIEQKGRPLEVYRAPKTKFAGEFIGNPPMNFLPAELTDVGFVCAGWRLPLEPPLELDTGFPVWLGVRAEDVVTHLQGGRGVPAKVEWLEQTGHDRFLYLQAAGQRVVAKLSNGAPLSIPAGTRVFLEFAHVRLYDRQDGAAI